MALKITDECINCDVCEDACPNQAIYFQDEHYHIKPNKCTECVGHYEVPQCEKLCPVDCIFQDENFVETKASLKQKYLKLTADE